MSLSDELRNELAAIAPRRECDRLAELSALFHSAGSLLLHGGGAVELQLELASPAVARRAFSLLRAFGVRSEIRTFRTRSFAKATRYELVCSAGDRAQQVFHEAGVVSARLAPLARPPKRVVARSCCRTAYLRGALLARATLTGPRSPQLELRTSTREGAEFVREVAATEGLGLTVHERPRHVSAYAKGFDAISGILAAVGAARTVLLLEERSVISSTRSRANRLANADHANLVRTSRSAHAQLQALRRLERRGQLERLPETLREAAELRLAHPSAPLRELATKCRPPATKAAVHRRLRRLQELAAE